MNEPLRDPRAELGACGDFNTRAWLVCALAEGHEGKHSFFLPFSGHRVCWERVGQAGAHPAGSEDCQHDQPADSCRLCAGIRERKRFDPKDWRTGTDKENRDG